MKKTFKISDKKFSDTYSSLITESAKNIFLDNIIPFNCSDNKYKDLATHLSAPNIKKVLRFLEKDGQIEKAAKLAHYSNINSEYYSGILAKTFNGAEFGRFLEETGQNEKALNHYFSGEGGWDLERAIRIANKIDKTEELIEDIKSVKNDFNPLRVANLLKREGFLEESAKIYVQEKRWWEAIEIEKKRHNHVKVAALYKRNNDFLNCARFSKKAGLSKRSDGFYLRALEQFEEWGRFDDAFKIAKEAGLYSRARAYKALEDE